MLNNIIKISFAIIGAITGYTLTKTFFYASNLNIPQNMNMIIFVLIPLVTAVLFYMTANRVIDWVLKVLDRLEQLIGRMTLYELAVSAAGLIAGLVVANLITIPVNKVDIVGIPISIITNILFGYLGITIAVGKRHDALPEAFKDKKSVLKDNKGLSEAKILDTSVIIDGRIVDICRCGFLEGQLIVPVFVLEELRHIADSADSIKRNRGRRGLDVLNILQKELAYPVKIENIEINDASEVDDKLLKMAKKMGGKVLTNDYNLNKVAAIQGVPVLNINELANAMRPIALPGEDMVVQIIKDGKENGQGIGYLDDGTMIVIEGGRKHIGEAVSVTVTTVLQTAAGRMIFAKPKLSA